MEPVVSAVTELAVNVEIVGRPQGCDIPVDSHLWVPHSFDHDYFVRGNTGQKIGLGSTSPTRGPVDFSNRYQLRTGIQQLRQQNRILRLYAVEELLDDRDDLLFCN